MQIKPPSPAEYAELAAQHAHRHPEKRQLSMPGPGGKPVSIPFVIGNPLGACSLPEGEKTTPWWNAAVAINMKLRREEPQDTDRLIDECVLWPDRKTYRELVQRWPGLPTSLLTIVREKYGGDANAIGEHTTDEALPPSVAAALAGDENATARILKFRGASFAVAIAPPDATAWRMFVEAIKKPGAKVSDLASEISAPSVLAAADLSTGKETTFADIAVRWPGIVIAVVATAGVLAGNAAKEEQVTF